MATVKSSKKLLKLVISATDEIDRYRKYLGLLPMTKYQNLSIVFEREGMFDTIETYHFSKTIGNLVKKQYRKKYELVSFTQSTTTSYAEIKRMFDLELSNAKCKAFNKAKEEVLNSLAEKHLLEKLKERRF